MNETNLNATERTMVMPGESQPQHAPQHFKPSFQDIDVAAPRHASAARWVVRVLLVCLLVFGVLAVRYLTEQTPDQTSLLSGTAEGYVVRKAQQVESGAGTPITSDPVKWLAERILLVSYKLSNHGLDIRHQAHTVEFGLLGAIIACNVLAWLSGWAHRDDDTGPVHTGRTVVMVLAAFALCMAASLADQFHKLSVPGRHFDKWDLVLDAMGYVTAIVVVFTIWGVASACYRYLKQRRAGASERRVGSSS